MRWDPVARTLVWSGLIMLCFAFWMLVILGVFALIW